MCPEEVLSGNQRPRKILQHPWRVVVGHDPHTQTREVAGRWEHRTAHSRARRYGVVSCLSKYLAYSIPARCEIAVCISHDPEAFECRCSECHGYPAEDLIHSSLVLYDEDRRELMTCTEALHDGTVVFAFHPEDPMRGVEGTWSCRCHRTSIC
jgi:hypothetical protein